MILGLEHMTIMIMKHVRFHEAEDLPCGTFHAKKWAEPTRQKMKVSN